MFVRLILSFFLVVLVSVVSVVVIAQQGAAHEVRSFMFQGGMNRLETLAATLEDYYQTQGSWEGVDELFKTSSHGQGSRANQSSGQGSGTMMSGMMNQRLRLADPDGLILADSGSYQPGDRLTVAELERALPLKTNSQTIGYLISESAMMFSAGDEVFLVQRLTRAALIAGAIALGLSLLLGFYLAFRLLRPVQQLTQAARLLAAGDLSQRVATRGRDEMAELGLTFNQMADSLQKTQESRRAMTADIAHELRTPLAIQRANLEAMLDGIYPLAPENLEAILEQNRLLSFLVDDLRTLALADAGQLNLDRSFTDLKALLEGLATRFTPSATRNQVSIHLNAPPDCPLISLDPARIEQILSNLLSNALRYTPQGGMIQINYLCNLQEMQIQVHDSGPGIPEESLPHIFERFYRADRSRSREEGGSGLGLAIARQLAVAHSGTLTAANHPHGGALFTLTLPISLANE